MSLFPVIVGTLTTTETREVVRHYETAAWETRIEVLPGTYPVIAYGPEVDSVAVLYTGRVVMNYMPALWAGNVIKGAGHGQEREGKVETVAQTILATTYGEDATLRADVAWDLTRVAQHPTLPWRILVQGAKAEELSFPVESVTTYEVNKGYPTAFWRVVVKATPVNPAANGGTGWSYGSSSYSPAFIGGGFEMDQKLTEAQARKLVAQITARGAICPARWRSAR